MSNGGQREDNTVLTTSQWWVVAHSVIAGWQSQYGQNLCGPFLRAMYSAGNSQIVYSNNSGQREGKRAQNFTIRVSFCAIIIHWVSADSNTDNVVRILIGLSCNLWRFTIYLAYGSFQLTHITHDIQLSEQWWPERRQYSAHNWFNIYGFCCYWNKNCQIPKPIHYWKL